MSPLPPHHPENNIASILSFLVYAFLNEVICIFGYCCELISSTTLIIFLSKIKKTFHN